MTGQDTPPSLGRIGKGWMIAALASLGSRPGRPQVTLQWTAPAQALDILPHPDQEGPAMPAIPALLAGPGLPEGAAIQWRGRVQYATRQRSPLVLSDSFELRGGTGCPAELFRHPADPGRGADREVIRGGSLRLSAAVLQAGAPPGPPASLEGLRLRLGEQPDRHRVRERLTLGPEALPHGIRLDGPTLTAWIRAIACQESRWRQNAVSDEPDHFQALGEPLMNRGGDGGIGIMQRTPYGMERSLGHRIQDWLWDWTANVDEGLRLFRAEKLRGSAAGFPDRVARCEAFRVAVETTRRHRDSQALPALGRIRVPRFTAEQLLRDAVRGYNGYAGRDALGMPLHQYRLKTQATAFGLVLDLSDPEPDPEDPLRPMAWAVWEEVPAAHRPLGGDRAYVSHVAARLHQPCVD